MGTDPKSRDEGPETRGAPGGVQGEAGVHAAAGPHTWPSDLPQAGIPSASLSLPMVYSALCRLLGIEPPA